MYGGLYGAMLESATFNLVLAIIVIAVALFLDDHLGFDRRLYRGAPDVVSRALESLRSRGLRVESAGAALKSEGPITLVIALEQRGEGEALIHASFKPTQWYLALTIIILALHTLLGIALAFLGYLSYRGYSRVVDEALSAAGLERIH